jgi:hypothetical protein
MSTKHSGFAVIFQANFIFDRKQLAKKEGWRYDGALFMKTTL